MRSILGPDVEKSGHPHQSDWRRGQGGRGGEGSGMGTDNDIEQESEKGITGRMQSYQRTRAKTGVVIIRNRGPRVLRPGRRPTDSALELLDHIRLL